MTKRYPLNEQAIVIYQDGIKPTIWSEYYTIFSIRDVCTRENCPYTDEHYQFDGQFFFQRSTS